MVSKFDKFRMCSANVPELGGTKFWKIGLYIFISAALPKKSVVQSLHVHQTLEPGLSCLSALDRQSLPAICIVVDSASGPDDCFHGIYSGLCLCAVEIAEVVEDFGIAVGDAVEIPDRPRNAGVATSLEKSCSRMEEPHLVHLVADWAHPQGSPDRSQIRPRFAEKYLHSSNAVPMMVRTRYLFLMS